MGERELICTDHHGRMPVSRVQFLTEVTIPPNTEMILQGKLNTRKELPKEMTPWEVIYMAFFQLQSVE